MEDILERGSGEHAAGLPGCTQRCATQKGFERSTHLSTENNSKVWEHSSFGAFFLTSFTTTQLQEAMIEGPSSAATTD